MLDNSRVSFRRFFHDLGPGLITGAADDDPSGIATYSVAGASLGYGPLWTALFSFPLMAAVQLMCARLGMVTGRAWPQSSGAIIRRGAVERLRAAHIANVINIGADLGGMADATRMVTGVSSLRVDTAIRGRDRLSADLEFYERIARVFKWLTLVLFAYVLAAFLLVPTGGGAARDFLPHIEFSRAYLSVFVGILGTTHLALPLLLAGRAGGGGRTREGRQPSRMRKGATEEELKKLRTM